MSMIAQTETDQTTAEPAPGAARRVLAPPDRTGRLRRRAAGLRGLRFEEQRHRPPLLRRPPAGPPGLGRSADRQDSRLPRSATSRPIPASSPTRPAVRSSWPSRTEKSSRTPPSAPTRAASSTGPESARCTVPSSTRRPAPSSTGPPRASGRGCRHRVGRKGLPGLILRNGFRGNCKNATAPGGKGGGPSRNGDLGVLLAKQMGAENHDLFVTWRASKWHGFEGRLSVGLSRVLNMDQRRFHRHRPGKRPGRYGAVRGPADRRWRVLETAARRPVGLRSPAGGDRPHRLRRAGPPGRGDRHPRHRRGPVLLLDRGAAAAGVRHLRRPMRKPASPPPNRSCPAS